MLPLCYQSIYPSSLSSRRRCHIMVSPSLSRRRSFVVAIAMSPSLLHCCSVIVTVSSSPLWCHLHRHIVTVSSSQSHHCGAFAVASLRFHRCRHHVAFIVTLSWCSLPFHHCHRGVAFVVASSQCCHCGFIVAVVVLLLLSHRRHLTVSS